MQIKIGDNRDCSLFFIMQIAQLHMDAIVFIYIYIYTYMHTYSYDCNFFMIMIKQL